MHTNPFNLAFDDLSWLMIYSSGYVVGGEVLKLIFNLFISVYKLTFYDDLLDNISCSPTTQ